MEVTDGHLLGGRIAYAQPRSGFRSGIEPVLLAASVPGRPGECVLEAGSGTGAALLCLAARLPSTDCVGLERDAVLASLATSNMARNGLYPRVQMVCGDVVASPFRSQVFDHAICNPPYHLGKGSPSPDPLRASAKQAGPTLLHAWARSLAASLRPRGTLTLILSAVETTRGLDALARAGCGSITLFPLWKRQGQPAKLLILRGVKGGGAGCRVLPGLVLHAPATGFTQAAEDVLRAGQALQL